MKRIERPKFFLPYAKDEAIAEKTWRQLRDRYGTTDQRIYSLMWEHKNVIHEAEVGKEIHKFPEPAGPVIAIIRAHQCFMVFTVFRGILRDVAVMVGDDEYIHHTEFDTSALTRRSSTIVAVRPCPTNPLRSGAGAVLLVQRGEAHDMTM